MELDKKKRTIAYRTLGCAIKVYKTLGPGLLEAVYHKAMLIELQKQGLKVESEVPVDVFYDGIDLNLGYRIDLLVEDNIVLEMKSVTSLERVHYKQIQNYLHLANKPFGYLINFNVDDFCLGIGFDRVRNFQYDGPISENLWTE